jgi:hypothetical protein
MRARVSVCKRDGRHPPTGGRPRNGRQVWELSPVCGFSHTYRVTRRSAKSKQTTSQKHKGNDVRQEQARVRAHDKM